MNCDGFCMPDLEIDEDSWFGTLHVCRNRKFGSGTGAE